MPRLFFFFVFWDVNRALSGPLCLSPPCMGQSYYAGQRGRSNWRSLSTPMSSRSSALRDPQDPFPGFLYTPTVRYEVKRCHPPRTQGTECHLWSPDIPGFPVSKCPVMSPATSFSCLLSRFSSSAPSFLMAPWRELSCVSCLEPEPG